MSRRSRGIEGMPERARRALARLGADLRTARLRRGWSLREAAARLMVTVVTLRRLEAGQPGVSLGLLAHALVLYGMGERLALLAHPAFDVHALEPDLRGGRSGDDFDV